MNDVKALMIEIYETYKYDWMNFKIDDEEVTYHHIIKEENGGKVTLDNGALLTSRAHEYLHMIERMDLDIYEMINKIFKDINDQKHAPTYKQRNVINLLLFEFETKNADKIIRKSHKLGKKRIEVATNKRLKLQLQKRR